MVSLTNKRESFTAMLNNPILTKSFEIYCMQSCCLESFLFIKAVRKFALTFEPSTAAEVATHIVNEFFSIGATLEVNLGEAEKKEIIQKIMRDEVDEKLFSKAEKIVTQDLRFNVFDGWQGSDSCRTVMEKVKYLKLEDVFQQENLC